MLLHESFQDGLLALLRALLTTSNAGIVGSFHVKWTKAGHEPSQILVKLFQMKGIHETRLF